MQPEVLGAGRAEAAQAQHGTASSAAGRWMQWAQEQTATETHSLALPHAVAQNPASESLQDFGTVGTEAWAAQAQHPVMGGGHQRASAAQAATSNEILDHTDEPGCELGGVDVAEQRHILNLIQMNTPKKGTSAAGAEKTASRGSIRKQSSILSLLNKR